MAAYLKATARKRSHDKDLQRTAHLRRFFAGKEINSLQPKDVRAYIAVRRGQGISDSTINRETALFAAAINYANTEWD